MKKLGLLGGISWVSTADYYKYINEGFNKRLGGSEFAECAIYSLNYGDIRRNNDANDWPRTLQMATKACEGLKSCGAEAIVLCANTMHLIADDLQRNINLPIIHIAVETGKEIKKQNLTKVGLLGTKFTMERAFFKDKLKLQNIEAVIPDDDERNFIHATIFDELGSGIIKEETKQKYLGIINKLISKGAQGIILGCTEIPLLIKQSDVNIPVFDTTQIHSDAAVAFSLGN